MAVEPLDDDGGRGARRRRRRRATSGRRRSPGSGPATPTWPAPSSTASTTSATSSSAPRRARPRRGSRPAASPARSCASSASRPGRSPPRSAASRSTRPTARRSRDEADASPLRCPDPDAEAAMIARIDEARSAGDTVGGVFEVVVHGLPIGLGSYVHWDRRLDAALAAAVMSINIVKGVEFGLGFEQTRRFGSARPRRHRGPRRRRPLGPPHEQRRRPDRRRHQRRAARRPRRGQADLHARPAAAVGRPRHRRGRRQGALRAERHQRRARRPASSARRWSCSPWRAFVLEKFGGDTLDDVQASLERYRARIAARARGAGRRVAVAAARPAAAPRRTA